MGVSQKKLQDSLHRMLPPSNASSSIDFLKKNKGVGVFPTTPLQTPYRTLTADNFSPRISVFVVANILAVWSPPFSAVIEAYAVS